MRTTRLAHAHNIADLQAIARARLPKGIYEYIARGAEDETGLAGNRAAFDAVRFLPRVLRDVSEVILNTTILGHTSSMPIAIAPTGGAGIIAWKGDLALARAAKAAGVPFIVSGASNVDIEELAAVGARLWFQLYRFQDPALTRHVVDRAQASGCETLVITCDVPVVANREYNARNGFGIPFRPRLTNTLDILRHPRWFRDTIVRYWCTSGMPHQANLPATHAFRITQSPPPGARFSHAEMSWRTVRELRERWPGKLVLKGILRPDDAEQAVALGCDAIVVSSHGARSLDCALPPLLALPAIVSAVGQRIEIMVDSGIMRGSDIAKALASGASAVLVGRAPLYGLAAAADAGALRALELLRTELARTLGFLGARNVSEVTPDLLTHI